MKTIIRSLITTAAGLFLTSWIVPGFQIVKDPLVFGALTGALVLANWFIKPILKIVFLPLNIATFGLFTIVINALILYGISYFLSGITISDWTFSGFDYSGFHIPEISFGIIGTYLVSGFIIGIVTTVVTWLTE
ncbi:MAG: phage holin family protein [Candidatus Roizmanbacteria bacterium]|nr:phage holin family protein [Candidatus Roizmanbacteria bacterium]